MNPDFMIRDQDSSCSPSNNTEHDVFVKIRRRAMERKAFAARSSRYASAAVLCGFIGLINFLQQYRETQRPQHLFFEKASVSDVAAKLNAAFGIKIITDESFSGCAFSGTLYAGSGREAVELIARSWGVKCYPRGGNEIVLERRE